MDFFLVSFSHLFWVYSSEVTCHSEVSFFLHGILVWMALEPQLILFLQERLIVFDNADTPPEVVEKFISSGKIGLKIKIVKI